MNSSRITELRKAFEDAVQHVETVEFWFARELQELLGYAKWQNFEQVIEKAMQACNTSGETIADHFTEAYKTVELGKGGKREIKDTMLTRYACYLIAQNGNPQKEEIAFAQSYFAVQTRKQELIEDRIKLNERLKARKKLTQTEKELSEAIYQRGVDQQGFGRIRSRGDQILFGGYTTQDMKTKLAVPTNRPLADFLPEITIKAKDLAASVTTFNLKANDLYGEEAITQEHVLSNQDLREYLVKRGIQPENLPAEEDIKKLERRVKSNDKKLLEEEKKRLK